MYNDRFDKMFADALEKRRFIAVRSLNETFCRGTTNHTHNNRSNYIGTTIERSSFRLCCYRVSYLRTKSHKKIEQHHSENWKKTVWFKAHKVISWKTKHFCDDASFRYKWLWHSHTNWERSMLSLIFTKLICIRKNTHDCRIRIHFNEISRSI